MIRLSVAIAGAVILTGLAIGVPAWLHQLDALYSAPPTTPVVLRTVAPSPTPTPTTESQTSVVAAAPAVLPQPVYPTFQAPKLETFTPTAITSTAYQATPPVVKWQPTPTPVCHIAFGC